MSLGIGIIGFGNSGKLNFEGIKNAGAKVLAVSDINKNNFCHKKYSCVDFYNNPNDLINRKDINLIIVATPDDKHLDITKLILNSGKYVFIEKPLVTKAKEMVEMENLCFKYPNKIIYSEKYSFAPIIDKFLEKKVKIGNYLYGTTFYTMGMSEKIMGGSNWRTKCSYNPCAGGLSHNFMVGLLVSNSKIKRIRARGKILTYQKYLAKLKGYDFMEGEVEFDNGSTLNWVVDLSTNGNNSLFGHRTVAHFFQFKNGSLAYDPSCKKDLFKLNGKCLNISQEFGAKNWNRYNIYLYTKMFRDILSTIERNGIPRHNVLQGINVSRACILAYDSAQKNGKWLSL